MTNAELIEALKKLPLDMDVVVDTLSGAEENSYLNVSIPCLDTFKGSQVIVL